MSSHAHACDGQGRARMCAPMQPPCLSVCVNTCAHAAPLRSSEPCSASQSRTYTARRCLWLTTSHCLFTMCVGTCADMCAEMCLDVIDDFLLPIACDRRHGLWPVTDGLWPWGLGTVGHKILGCVAQTCGVWPLACSLRPYGAVALCRLAASLTHA